MTFLILLVAWIIPAAFPEGGITKVLAVYTVAVALWLLVGSHASPPRAIGLVVIALLCRMGASIFTPALSDDVYRYLWDGRVSASGRSPYVAPPDDPGLAPLHQPWHSRINHPEIRSIYPPLAQLWFFVNQAIGGGLWSWKLLLLFADLATIILLYRYLSARAAFVYALCPVVLLEGFWNAHIEIIAASFFLASLVALSRRRFAAAGVFLGIAAGTKVIPLAAAPALLKFSRRLPALLGLMATAIAPLLFFLGKPLMPGMQAYAKRWIFNSPAYDIVHRIVSFFDVGVRLKSSFIVVKDHWKLEPIAPYIYSYAYDDFITRAVLGGVFLIALIVILRKAADGGEAMVLSVGALILCSPTIHPWYWLVLLPAALATRQHFWTAFALCAPFSYLLYEGYSPWLVFLLCYGVPIAAAASIKLARRASLTPLSARASSGAESRSAGFRVRREPGTSPE